MESKFIEYLKSILFTDFNTEIKKATSNELYNSLGKAFNRYCNELYTDNNSKRVCYFSAEYLMGKILKSNLFNLDLLNCVENYLNKYGRSLDEFEDIEDLGLGNGGLGRLAAGFLDSGASVDIPLDGYGIRYKYGYFKQLISENQQKEIPDDWLDYSDPFGQRYERDKVVVEFKNEKIYAVPYVYNIPGYHNERINRLYLFQSEAIDNFDYEIFNNGDHIEAFRQQNSAESITAVLYPEDSTNEGKILRLKQQYFFTSASLQLIIKKHLNKGMNIKDLDKSTVIQLNDTHPVIAIAECIRLIMEEGSDFEFAFQIAKKIFAYTNHTIMSEALEKWDIKLLIATVPKIYDIILLIDCRLKNELKKLNLSTDKYFIVKNDTVYMANLACYVCFSINGVAKIHSEIIKNETLNQWYQLYPYKFNNKTNGVTQRRWIALANPNLNNLLIKKIGAGYLADFQSICRLEDFANEKILLSKLSEIKFNNKVALAKYIFKKENVVINPDFIFCTQIKRIHEYKRQLMNIFSIIDIYFKIKDGNENAFPPTLFIIGGKAAPGYKTAKRIIEFINFVANRINNDADTKGLIQIIYIKNYSVSYAEKIIPATDISEQISLAGKEASGTSNMKFMMNGALTLGTYDGANIEIVEKAGESNNYIFGIRENDVLELKNKYDPIDVYESDKNIKRVVNTLIDNTFLLNDEEPFRDIFDLLMDKDEYMILKDLPAYIKRKTEAIKDCKDVISFQQKALLNIANSYDFSCDRTIKEYANDIWFKEC